MKFAVVLAVLLLSVNAFASAKIDPSLANFLKGSPSKKTRVIALLAPTATKAPKRYNYKAVVQFYRANLKQQWKEVEAELKNAKVRGTDLKIVRLNALNLSIAADVTPEGLKALASATLVQKIYANSKVERARPTESRPYRPNFESEGRQPYDFAAVGLDKHISANPNVDGQGVVLGHIDTGVEADHPALKGKIISFYDGEQKKLVPANDPGGHGTHTAGTMVGGNWKSQPMGMAPGAKILAAGNTEADTDLLISCMEYFLDPDKNPNTKDFPRAINNSWNTGFAPDQEPFYRAVEAWEAAGILAVFSAGNSGPKPKTITPPHEHPLVLAVGATDQEGKIAKFSSVGPGSFRGKDTQKPDVVAPGVEIVSAVPGKKLEAMNGTSMAAPHVAGLTALLYQEFPNLNPQQMRLVFIKSATPLNASGGASPRPTWNAKYGHGAVNIVNAFKLAKNAQLLRDNSNTGFARDFFSFTSGPVAWDANAVASAAAAETAAIATYVETPEESARWVTLEDLGL